MVGCIYSLPNNQELKEKNDRPKIKVGAQDLPI
jgi:predicted adenine nucleotide alpha hydrolase (AANH) superfamily ATPase